MLKSTILVIFVIGAVLFSNQIASASDFSFFMWDQTISGKAYGQDSSTSSRVEATIDEHSSNDKGFRLVSTLIGAPTEFGYTKISNNTSLQAEGSFYFNGKEFDVSQPIDYNQSMDMYEFFPRLPLFSRDKFGLNLLLGFKGLDINTSITGTGPLSTPVTESIDEFVVMPQIGVRCFFGSLTRGLRVELMAKYLKFSYSNITSSVLDAEAIAYVKAKGGLDIFFGWKAMDMDVTLDEDEATEGGIDVKNSGLIYGGRIRF